MSLENDISRIRELLEVVTEVVVEKADNKPACLCQPPENNEANIEYLSPYNDGAEMIEELRDWLASQINFAYQAQSDTLAFQTTLDMLNEIVNKRALSH